MKTNKAFWATRNWLSAAALFLLLPVLLSLAPAPSELPSLTLTQRQICDLELILNGGFSPLESFMGQKDYERVLKEMRLENGMLWPMPIMLDISAKNAEKMQPGTQIALKDQEGFILAVLDVSELWEPNKQEEAERVYATTDTTHPGVNYLLNRTEKYYISGKISKIQDPLHFDFLELRKTPEELKQYFKDNGINQVVAFQTNNPMHRAQLELTKRATELTGAHLLIHSPVGMTNPGDIDYFTRVKCYKKLLSYYSEGNVTLNVFPLAMRMGGEREALWNAIIQKNYGCSHFIMGKGQTESEKAAQQFVKAYADEIGIEVVSFQECVYVQEDDCYQMVEEINPGKTILSISNTELKKILNEGGDIPAWFTFSEVAEELRKVYPPRQKQGFTLFFTGLSGSGKSTLAKAVSVKLMELQDRPLTMLDGDVIRTHLSSELGFSKEHRALNVRRVGYVASEITKNRGIAICAMIAPYAADRNFAREMISAGGNFIEIYVSTSFDVCAERDTKGLYNLAKEGKLKGFTGLDDPYEIPLNPEVVIDTTRYTISEGADIILNYLRQIHHID